MKRTLTILMIAGLACVGVLSVANAQSDTATQTLVIRALLTRDHVGPPVGAYAFAQADSIETVGTWKLVEQDTGAVELQLVGSDDVVATWNVQVDLSLDAADAAAKKMEAAAPRRPFSVAPVTWSSDDSLPPMQRWASDSFCLNPDSMFRATCFSLETVLTSDALMATMAWGVTLRYGAAHLESCREKNRCKWKASESDVAYQVVADDTVHLISLRVDKKAKVIVGTDAGGQALLRTLGYPEGLPFD